MQTPPILHHYTCDHALPRILACGELRPGIDGVLWLTDMAVPNRQALGLTSHTLTCDRLANRLDVSVDPRLVMWWMVFRRDCLANGHRAYVEARESAPGARPMHWWVAAWPIPLKARHASPSVN
jgi:hypothetical protein